MAKPVKPPQIKTYPNKCFENGKKFYLSEKAADVHFTFGAVEEKAKRVPAHKTLLATDSDVFEAMFYGDLNEPGDIDLPDTTEAAFKEFLQYFYLSEVKLTAGNIIGVLYLAAKYDVKKCVNDCVQFLMCTLDSENVCAYLGDAILYDNDELMKACEAHILLDTVAVFRSGGFLKCDKNVLDHILKMDKLSCSEVDVFKACMSWVKARIGRADLTIDLVDKHLGELYYGIRFASLTMDQLCALQIEYEAVLTRDFITISRIIVMPDYHEPKFKTRPRHVEWNADAVIECNRHIGNSSEEGHYRVRKNDYCFRTTFSVNKPLFLGSFKCKQIWMGESDWICTISTDIEISQSDSLTDTSSKVLTATKIKFEEDGTTISLPHPVLIGPGFFYTIRIGPFPNDELYTYYCENLKEKMQLEADYNIEFHKNPNHSLISSMKFNKI